MLTQRLTHWLARSEKSRVCRRLTLDCFEDRVTPTVVTFQEGQPLTIDGVNQTTNYVGTADTEITSNSANASVNFGEVVTVSIDQQDAAGVRQVLLRFDNIFGDDPGQIPVGARINSAKVDFNVDSPTNDEG